MHDIATVEEILNPPSGPFRDPHFGWLEFRGERRALTGGEIFWMWGQACKNHDYLAKSVIEMWERYFGPRKAYPILVEVENPAGAQPQGERG